MLQLLSNVRAEKQSTTLFQSLFLSTPQNNEHFSKMKPTCEQFSNTKPQIMVSHYHFASQQTGSRHPFGRNTQAFEMQNKQLISEKTIFPTSALIILLNVQLKKQLTYEIPSLKGGLQTKTPDSHFCILDDYRGSSHNCSNQVRRKGPQKVQNVTFAVGTQQEETFFHKI